MPLQYVMTLSGPRQKSWWRRLLGLNGPHGGGGHGGGGGGGGGGHHGGGGFHPHGGGGGYWQPGGYWANTGPEVVVVQETACPQVYAPVLGSDNQIYGNACLAQMAGVAIVKSLPVKSLRGPLDTVVAHPWVGLLGIGVGVFFGLRAGKKRR